MHSTPDENVNAGLDMEMPRDYILMGGTFKKLKLTMERNKVLQKAQSLTRISNGDTFPYI
jgi:hypothetical protein